MLASLLLPPLRSLKISSERGLALANGLTKCAQRFHPAAVASRALSAHHYSSGNAHVLSRTSLVPFDPCHLNGQKRHRSNRSRRGLYDGKDVRSGNRVSFSMKKTKRKFKPNVFKKSVYSETLDQMVRFHITTSALRSIDRMGGLDNYLLKSKHVTSGEGLATKKRILRRMKQNEKKKNQAESAVVETAESKEDGEERMSSHELFQSSCMMAWESESGSGIILKALAFATKW
eukprot:CAMPEP_0197443264 /NCGR_PEP_ID=MMETSP1175-20131217/9042_1 /TAXON_ID=1003142 /ORGANISM="Triceratium dubium, Strain CCMP147" /LENGTH=231 /DNA_ID=CAMNT_0042973869 /DNA_START=18 /DNA_END=714 /DNA_ORIENTATION=+